MMEEIVAGSSSNTARLCYLNAAHVEGPLPSFDGVEMRAHDDRKIGRLDGIIIDPAERRVRYLVVDDGGFLRHHRYLLPLLPIRVDPEHPALRVDVDKADLRLCEEFDHDAFPSFSDDDLLTGLFAVTSRTCNRP